MTNILRLVIKLSEDLRKKIKKNCFILARKIIVGTCFFQSDGKSEILLLLYDTLVPDMKCFYFPSA